MINHRNARSAREGLAALALGVGIMHTATAQPAAARFDPPALPAPAPATISHAAPGGIEEMLAQVSAERLRNDVDRLAAFGTRHTLSDTESDTRGIGAARRWVRDQFERAAFTAKRPAQDRVAVFMDEHRVEPDGRRIDRSVDVVNVVAVIPGAMPEARHRQYYILAHLDSRATDALDAESEAPGANDAASGVAMMLEMARVMGQQRFDSTIVLMATSGEEQGLFGARLHATQAREHGVDVRAVLNNDTVGDPYGPFDPASERGAWARGVVRVFSEGVPPRASADDIATIARMGAENDSPARQVARYMAEVAALHDLPVKPMLVFRNDRFLRGGDHTAFLEAGFPASVRVTVPFEDYDRQHQDVRVEGGKQFGDLPEYIDEDYLADVTRLNMAVVAHLANAPSAPDDARVIVVELEHDTTLRWSPSPEPDVAGYEVVRRSTASPMWEHVHDVGLTTEATLPYSKDNWLFGVRAYDSDGYRSPVSFPGVARE